MSSPDSMKAADGLLPLPCNLLIGPLFNPAVLGAYRRHPQIRTFVSTDFPAESADIRYDIRQDHFADLLGRLPPDWRPELLIWWDPVYQALPPGVADCPIPTAVVAGDWNLQYFVSRHYFQAFDFVLGDKALLRLLAAEGHTAHAYWPGWGFDPQVHRRLDIPQTVDITFIGNLNHRVQRRRGAYLERLARLADRYRVRIEGGLYGDAYTEALNRSRIVFNLSICGGMNMRAFEVPACGSLLFMEADNAEVRDFLCDGISCVLYDDATLETRLSYFLEHETERAAIAAAGHRVIQVHSYEKQFERLIALLPRILQHDRGPRARPFGHLPRELRLLIECRQLFQANTHGSRPVALDRLMRAADFGQPSALSRVSPRWLNQIGVFLFDACSGGQRFGPLAPESAERQQLMQARELFLAAGRQLPDQGMPRFNAGVCEALLNQIEAASAEFHAALALWQDVSELDPWLLPVRSGGYAQRLGVEWENQLIGADRSGLPRLMRWQTYEALGDLALRQSDLETAISAYTSALAERDEFGETWLFLGQAHYAGGNHAAATAAYVRAIEAQPFLVSVWLDLARLWLLRLDFAAVLAFLPSRCVMLQVNPELAKAGADCHSLLGLARLGQALLDQLPAVWLPLLPPTFSPVTFSWLRRWQSRLPPALSEELRIGWQPAWPEALFALPEDYGFRFVPGPQPEGVTLGRRAAPAELCFARGYRAHTDLAAGWIGPDRLPYGFADLSHAETIVLEDQRSLNLLLIAADFTAVAVRDWLNLYARYTGSADVCLFLWNPAGIGEGELQSLERQLADAQAPVSLLQDQLGPLQQGMLLKSMQLVLGDAGSEICYFLGWSLQLGVPLGLLANALPFRPCPQDRPPLDATEAWPEVLPPLRDFEALLTLLPDLQAAAPKLQAAWQQLPQRQLPQLLDLCWELRLWRLRQLLQGQP